MTVADPRLTAKVAEEEPISFEAALDRVLARVEPGPVASFPVEGGLSGRVLAEPLLARMDSPPFDTSAVDGYAVRSSDLPGLLRRVGCAVPGSEHSSSLRAGETVRILTGARVPAGADAVAMQEDCDVRGDSVLVAANGRRNIRYRGEEYRKGDELLPEGTAVTPRVRALLAASGLTHFRARRGPKVGIVVTGDELCPPGEFSSEHKLFASHGPSLASEARALGVEADWRLAPDDPEALMRTLDSVLNEVDLLVTTGGASVGDHDYVKESLEAFGIERVFWRVRMKPGKPVYFGTRGKKLVFALPGSPLAALFAFHGFVVPAIRTALGASSPFVSSLPCRLGSAVEKRPGRTEFVLVRLETGGDAIVAHPMDDVGSHGLRGAAMADGYLRLDEPAEFLESGSNVRVVPF